MPGGGRPIAGGLGRDIARFMDEAERRSLQEFHDNQAMLRFQLRVGGLEEGGELPARLGDDAAADIGELYVTARRAANTILRTVGFRVAPIV